MARAPDDIHHLYPRLDEICKECFDSRHPIKFEQSHAGTVRLLVHQHIPLTVWELGSDAGIHSPHSHGLEACYKMKPTESRKSNKPIMEKRRRARINQCLNELKTLILEALRKDPSRHSKLEKADILEMTVKYLQNLQRQQMALTMATNPQIMSKYRAGFGECVAEVSRFLSGSPAVDTAVQQRLISHLTSNLNGLEPINDDQVNLGIPMSSLSTAEFRRQCRGLQLIPTRLPGGEVLFFVPSNSPFVSSYSSSVPLTPSTEPLSIQVSPEQEIGDDKNAPCTDVAQDLTTKLSVSSSGSDSPQTPADEDESGASGDPWRPW